MQNLWNNLQNSFKQFLDDNGFKKVILRLSGGLDSAIVAVLAADVLGGENVKAIMMKTKYTSDLSLDIARKIAKLNKLNYQELDIDTLVDSEITFLQNAFNNKVEGIVAENLQARVRGQILMAFSNQNGGMVLACGNKSEAMTGYCTLYGDTCGGLMPIGNVYKSTIFELAKWRNGISKVLPEEVISRAPSAELAYNQKDENSLPPYSILDKILRKLVDEGQSIDKIIAQGEDKELIQKVNNLVSRSAFKRRQLPPAL